MNLKAYANQIKKQLENAGVSSPAFEVALLFEKVFSLSRTQLLSPEREIDENLEENREKMTRLEAMVSRRIEGYPLQYLLGEWEFFGLPFWVGEGVLIPRPDTETVVEQALALLKGKEAPRILDLCSGSGCIAIALAHERPDSRVTAVELSEKAFSYLARNRKRNQAVNLTAVQGDALDTGCVDGKFDLIVSNPPYIRPEEMEALQKEVRFEPKMALRAEEEGLFFYKRISRLWKGRIRPGGYLLFEIGWKQAAQVMGILRQEGFMQVDCAKDYGGNDRAVWGRSNR